jgi:hypothetical protein
MRLYLHWTIDKHAIIDVFMCKYKQWVLCDTVKGSE